MPKPRIVDDNLCERPLPPFRGLSARTQEALVDACTNGNLSKLKFLLAVKEDSSEAHEATLLTLLAEATEKCHTDVVRYLLEETSTADYSEQLMYSAIGAGLEIYKLSLF